MIVDVNSKGLPAMKKHLFRSGFNLIEVTMAIAIVGIGIAGVMALFPPAIEANKNANFQNFTGTVVNNVAAYLDYQLKYEWNWDDPDNSKHISKKIKVKASATTPEQQTNIATWPGDPAEKVGWKTVDNFPGLFQPFDKDKKTHDDWLGIKSQDDSIAAHVRVWRDDANRNTGYFDQSAVTMNNDFRTRVVIELSWPVAKAYADREKQEFVYEFNKPE